MDANDAPVLNTLVGLLHRACPPIGRLPAAMGTCAAGVTVLPVAVVAYEALPITAVGVDHTLPVMPVDTAEVGTLGPRKSPTVEVATPESRRYVPALKTTSAVKVPAMGFTEVT